VAVAEDLADLAVDRPVAVALRVDGNSYWEKTMHCNACGHDVNAEVEMCPGCEANLTSEQYKVHLPKPVGAVNDFPGILTKEQVEELSTMVVGFFEQTDVPVVIAIVETTAPLLPNEYAFLLYNHWGIGKPKINRGVLLLLCLKEKWLESEVGLGLERLFPETEGDRIVREEFIPHFNNGNYFGGLKSGTEALIKELQKRLPPSSQV
jgi:uncharacterized membrane protein YgcG